MKSLAGGASSARSRSPEKFCLNVSTSARLVSTIRWRMSSGCLIRPPEQPRGKAGAKNHGLKPALYKRGPRPALYGLAFRATFGYPLFGSYSGSHHTEVVDMPLTKRQKEILDHVESFIEKHGYAPSFEEIADAFGYSSLATVHEHLSNLERKGYIRKAYNESRSIELVGATFGANATELPLLGAVAAGLPIEVIEQQETIAVPPDMVRSGGKNFVLRVEGESMIDEQIRDGDYIVVSSQETAADGQMVVALIGGDSATVKKMYREPDGRIRLQPANPSMPPIVEDASNVQIQGVVVGVIRKY